jgi:hypothetical protein
MLWGGFGTTSPVYGRKDYFFFRESVLWDTSTQKQKDQPDADT